jgi:hypothetical protein
MSHDDMLSRVIVVVKSGLAQSDEDGGRQQLKARLARRNSEKLANGAARVESKQAVDISNAYGE